MFAFAEIWIILNYANDGTTNFERESAMASTLKMVAEQAGVSIRTAGRALRGGGPVKKEVAEAVRRAAEALHYVPNAAARSLKQRESRIVGVIAAAQCRSEAAQRKIQLLEKRLAENGRHTLLGTLPENQVEFEALLREWSGIVGHVILFSWDSNWETKLLHNYPMRFIFLDRPIDDSGFDRLLTDRTSGVAAAVEDLIRNGRRRIAHVGTMTAEGRGSGFERALATAPSLIESLKIESAGLELADGYAAGPELEHFRADAVFFDTDRMALGFYRYAHEHGIAIPEDVAVAGFDDDSAGAYAIPTLTTVAHPDAELITRAVELVTASAAPPPATAVFPTRLIRRESSGKNEPLHSHQTTQTGENSNGKETLRSGRYRRQVGDVHRGGHKDVQRSRRTGCDL